MHKVGSLGVKRCSNFQERGEGSGCRKWETPQQHCTSAIRNRIYHELNTISIHEVRLIKSDWSMIASLSAKSQKLQYEVITRHTEM